MGSLLNLRKAYFDKDFFTVAFMLDTARVNARTIAILQEVRGLYGIVRLILKSFDLYPIKASHLSTIRIKYPTFTSENITIYGTFTPIAGTNFAIVFIRNFYHS
jgi:hypothetical protein